MPKLYLPDEPFGSWLAETLGEQWFEVQSQAEWAILCDLGDRWLAVFDADGWVHFLDLCAHDRDERIWLMRLSTRLMCLHTNYDRDPRRTVRVQYFVMPEGWQYR